jgi:hypothetical protein
MSFTVEWALDPEVINERECLGTIRLSSAHGVIREDSVYLDSWFCALIQAASSDLPEVSVDIPEESHRLKVCRHVDGSIEIRFGQQGTIAQSASEFREAVYQAVRQFIHAAAAETARPSVLAKLRNLLARF